MDARILLVEDNDDARQLVRWLLELHGFQVLEAADGEAALTVVEREHPRLALIDLGLPGIDGYELARRIRSGGNGGGEMRLVAMTGYDSDADRARTRDAGFDTHLVKPVDADELIRVLRPAA